MAPPNLLSLIFAIFLSIFAISCWPTSAILPSVTNPVTAIPSKLVEDFCNSNSIGDRTFCLKALSDPKATAAKDSTQLGKLIMKSGAKNGKKTLKLYDKMMKKPSPFETLKALNSCAVAYKYAIQSFEMVSTELVEDAQTANYDITLVAPEITNCEKELNGAKIQTPKLHDGNRFMQYYTAMGIQITSTLQFENEPNES